MLTSLVFYPSLGYNLFRNYVQPSRWPWYNRVDDTLILGAMPFQSMRDELITKENVGGVVCCTEEYELKAAMNAMREEDWRKAGVEWMAVPMKDFTGTAPRAEINEAVEFIENVASKGKTVYVHCKATCATEANGTIAPATQQPINSTVIVANVTALPVTGSTEEGGEDEKPITETIRTYIEDSVKSVKHAISKIGKFVGEFFDDSAANSTAHANVSTTVVPTTVLSTTVVHLNATTVLPEDN
uniref:DSPc domain-containing protein n=1 Tax=Caenorhabditis tropicalis TaxID=1561998 RepID=A0A1I7TA49_9PELO